MTGHLHPLTILLDEILDYYTPLGFEVVYGSEIQTDQTNFDALNFPPDHPARDVHDTFYLEDGRLLRTHTTALYKEALQGRSAPVRLLFPGRTFRNEATDNTHNHTFNQLDCLVIDETANLGQLVGTLQGMMKHLFGKQLDFRIRPSYFPFVEPGVEFDIKKSGSHEWLEMLGAGMVHPNVLTAIGVDPKKYQGFAFGMGLERVLSLLTDTPDIRVTMSGDYRYLGQFL